MERKLEKLEKRLEEALAEPRLAEPLRSLGRWLARVRHPGDGPSCRAMCGSLPGGRKRGRSSFGSVRVFEYRQSTLRNFPEAPRPRNAVRQAEGWPVGEVDGLADAVQSLIRWEKKHDLQ